MINTKALLRASVILILIGTFTFNAIAYTNWTEDFSETAPPANGITVIAEQDMGVSGSPTALTAYAPNGSIMYQNTDYEDYFDIDPIDGRDNTIIFIGTTNYVGECIGGNKCTKIDVVMVDLNSSTETITHSRVVPGKNQYRWHDVDLVEEDQLLIAEIGYDRVRLVNLTSETIEFSWWAQADYPIEEGGPYPKDWTHLNDVEYIEGNRIMVSLRNQDQVVFLDPKHGLLANLTLGADDDHMILFEQHNPDYIPENRGGPAVLVADSENNRIVEYQRENGKWVKTWEMNRNLEWPRDADRLPNGHTLITDTHNNRVIEINREGEIIWEKRTYTPYEAERLPFDESAGGYSAQALGLSSINTVSESKTRINQTLQAKFKSLIPAKIVHGLKAITPAWVGVLEFASWLFAGLTLFAWFGTEYRWSKYRIGFQLPIIFHR